MGVEHPGMQFFTQRIPADDLGQRQDFIPFGAYGIIQDKELVAFHPVTRHRGSLVLVFVCPFADQPAQILEASVGLVGRPPQLGREAPGGVSPASGRPS